jgi:hypothetical protein
VASRDAAARYSGVSFCNRLNFEKFTLKDQILIIGIVVGLGVGYLIGALQHSETRIEVPPPPVPSNYDPARQMANDVLKSARESEQNCWSQLTAILIEKKSTETAH